MRSTLLANPRPAACDPIRAPHPSSPSLAGVRRGRVSGRPRIGIVGAGLMGRWHAHAARRVGARVLAVVDVQPERAHQLARRCPDARLLTDLDALAGMAIEIVHICTPLASHAALAGAAIERGLHALVEKPLTASADEAGALYAAADSAGILLCPVHQVAFQDGVERAIGALEALGAVCQISFTICSAGGAGRSPAELDQVVTEILPHPFSLLLRLWPAVPLDAETWQIEHPRPGELLLSGAHAGAVLSAFVSMTARPTRFELVVRCERGTIQLDLFHGYAVVEAGGVSRLRKIVQPFVGSGRVFGAAALNLCRRTMRREPAYPGLRTLVARFYDSVRSGGPPPVIPADAMHVARACDTLIGRLVSAPARTVVPAEAER